MEDEIKANLDAIYLPSEDMVIKEIRGEFVLIPITSGIVNLEDEMFKLNETAKTLWDKLDGKKTLKETTEELSLEFDAPLELIEKDALGLVDELLKRRMLIAVQRT